MTERMKKNLPICCGVFIAVTKFITAVLDCQADCAVVYFICTQRQFYSVGRSEFD